MKIAITGANGSVGSSLLSHIAGAPDLDAIALVRNERAAASLPRAPNIQARVADYHDEAALARTLEGAECLVHLAGILIENKASRYREANVEATAALVRAARRAGAGRIVFVSVVGADAAASNPYHRSKGEAERLLMESGIPSAVLRTPILLGRQTAGGKALFNAASHGKARLLGGGAYRMRPLDVDDLCAAVLRLCRRTPAQAGVFELAGPETVSYRELVERMAARLGKRVSIGAMPIPVAKAAAAIGFRLRGGGMSPAVIDVITMDEHVKENADEVLGIELTPLDETLRKLAGSASDHETRNEVLP